MNDSAKNEIAITVLDRDGKEQTIIWKQGLTMMEALRDNDLPVLASCGGAAACATCHVYLQPTEHSIAPVSSEELEMLEYATAFRPDASRLSCQIQFSPAFQHTTVELAPYED